MQTTIYKNKRFINIIYFSMNRFYSLFLFLIFLGIKTYAQTNIEFAPVGAKWYFDFGVCLPPAQQAMDLAYVKFECIGDTLIDTMQCKIINKYREYDYHGKLEVPLSKNYILYCKEKKVYEVENGEKYLLYDFTREVGEYWVLPKYDDTLYVEKIDTIELSNGEFSKRYVCKRTNEMLFYGAYIYERFGSDIYFFPANTRIPPMEGRDLRCYCEGEELIHTTNINRPCDYVSVGITEKSLETHMKIQNPVNDIISISLSDATVQKGIKQIKIYDMLGQNIFTLQEITSSNIQIPFSNYPPGIYIINITMKNLSSISHKIIKQ